MNRAMNTRLRKLESGDAAAGGARNVVVISYGPDETADEAAERHFESRPEDRGCPRIIPVNTGVPRSESYG
jgi:hypothetical protein